MSVLMYFVLKTCIEVFLNAHYHLLISRRIIDFNIMRNLQKTQNVEINPNYVFC